MKHQYFADRRDLFKYDLLLDILAAVPSLERLTFVPMLTPNDETGQGRLIAIAPGRRNPTLATFLDRCRQEKRQDLKALRAFMQSAGITYTPYRDDSFFDPSQRVEYFASIPVSSLTRALVFLDPDVGLEPSDARQMRRAGPEKYVLYEEVADLFHRADTSAIVVYQHLQRHKGKIVGDILNKASRLLRALVVETVGYVTDEDVVFYGVGTDGSVHDVLIREFERHGTRHNLAAGLLTT